MNVLFEMSNDPFQDDMASQYARMGLSISMENKISVLYRDHALLLASEPFDISNPNINYFNYERFLIEQEIDIYVLGSDLTALNNQMKTTIKQIEPSELKSLYLDQDVIFRN